MPTEPDCFYITGAGSGIGREFAKRYLQAGKNLALFDRHFSEEAKAQFAAEAQARGVNVHFLEVDICELPKLQVAMQEAEQRLGLPTQILHCAGILRAGEFVAVPEDQFAEVVQVNLVGSHHVARAALPALQKSAAAGKNPRLVMIASMAGLVGNYGYASYCASKFGVVGLAQVLRMELKPQGIRVQVICPPEVDTPMKEEEYKTIHLVTQKLKMLAGSLSLESAVDGMQRGIQANRFMIIPGGKARLTYWMMRWTPLRLSYAVVDWMVQRLLSSMPKSS